MSLSLCIVVARVELGVISLIIRTVEGRRRTRGMLRELPRGLQNGIISSSWSGRGFFWSPEISSSFRFLPNIHVKIENLNDIINI